MEIWNSSQPAEMEPTSSTPPPGRKTGPPPESGAALLFRRSALESREVLTGEPEP